MHIVISEFMDEDAVQGLRTRFNVLYDAGLVDRPTDLLQKVERADALIVRNRTQVDASLLARAASLKVVGRLGVGLDNIDLDACEKRSIKVIPATGANARAVAEYVIAATLILLRGAFGASVEVGRGDWPRTALSAGLEVCGRTLGIVGFGGIGRLVATLAQGLGMRVVACDEALAAQAPVWQQTGVERLALDALIRQSDAISLHVPLTPATRNLFDASRIAAMQPGAVLINTARGGIVDETALAQALHAGKLRGAALDVYAQEPLAAGTALAQAPNLLLTPHIAGLTAEANTRVSSMVAAAVADQLQSAHEGR